jgi:hypothetical protein
MSVSILILVALTLASITVLIIVSIKHFRLVKHFKPVISLEEETEKIRKEIDKDKSDAAVLVYEAKLKATNLGNSYIQAKQIFDKLENETALLQENLEDMSFGLYEPHYSFETSEAYKTAMEKIYEQKKALIRSDKAVDYFKDWTVNGSKQEGRRMTKGQLKLMLRAFNGECDAAIVKVTWNNAVRMEERIKKAYEAINALGVVNKIRITTDYLNICLSEFRLTYEYETKKQEEKEEQRAIREQMREEERAQRDFEKAQREAVAEQERAEKGLAAARAELQKATGEHLEAIQSKVQDLEKKVADAQAKQERAVSMAQVTKMGHVYVISNIGSFGDDVFKIGMTRRLDPSDRVQELSGASVPFGFDVHAMIFSDDAPDLETSFHRQFASRRLNLVNMRKEYFRVSLDEISHFAKSKGVSVEFTKLAEAKQFRESETIRLKAIQAGEAPQVTEPEFPEKLFPEGDED